MPRLLKKLLLNYDTDVKLLRLLIEVLVGKEAFQTGRFGASNYDLPLISSLWTAFLLLGFLAQRSPLIRPNSRYFLENLAKRVDTPELYRQRPPGVVAVLSCSRGVIRANLTSGQGPQLEQAISNLSVLDLPIEAFHSIIVTDQPKSHRRYGNET